MDENWIELSSRLSKRLEQAISNSESEDEDDGFFEYVKLLWPNGIPAKETDVG